MGEGIGGCRSDLILFAVQVCVIKIVVIVSLVNLTYGWGNQNLWTVLLTSSLGYIMPNPKIRVGKDGKIERQKSINEDIENGSINGK